MRKSKQLAVTMAAAALAAMLAGASAFAEERPARGTEARQEWRESDSRGREYDRDRGRNESRNRDEYRNDRDRNDSRSRQPYVASGRVSRVDRYGSGYRVWVGRERYPFFVPQSYYRRDRFRVGVTIQLGGYYNPAGYYDYYDGPYDNRAYSRGDLRGTVESVDYRRDTFVVRNDATGSFVTVVTRDRRYSHVRAGDFVELTGDWSRSGVFQAYRVDVLDGYRGRRW